MVRIDGLNFPQDRTRRRRNDAVLDASMAVLIEVRTSIQRNSNLIAVAYQVVSDRQTHFPFADSSRSSDMNLSSACTQFRITIDDLRTKISGRSGSNGSHKYYCG